MNPLNLWILKLIADLGYGSNKCIKKGFLITPVHFYSPIPDLKFLEQRKVWDKKSELHGINFNEKKQLVNLKKLGKGFAKECDWPLSPTEDKADFYVDNDSFSYGCAAILHSMIREHKPKNIIEIGSGSSSKIIAKAIKINNIIGIKTHYTIIDPYPAKYISKKLLKYNRLISKCVETVDPRYFDRLGENDILFIDSSHMVKIGNDVNFLYLDILPRLKPGVIVHIHDIGLPYEYPKSYATSETFRQFWTEQYLLQSFLICNHDFEIILAMANIMTNYTKEFQLAFPKYDSKIHKLTSGSFWLKRVSKS